MKQYITLFFLLLAIPIISIGQDSTSTIWSKLKPHAVNVQFGGNIGLISTGINYISPNKHWRGNLSYGFVPKKYADDPIHSVTVKGKYGTFQRKYNDLEVEWLNVGLWYNYSFGYQYFVKLPHYYDEGYYYFPTAINVGLTLGNSIKYKKWGAYYEVGTTDKRIINYVKSLKAINYDEIWNISFGLIYFLK